MSLTGRRLAWIGVVSALCAPVLAQHGMQPAVHGQARRAAKAAPGAAIPMPPDRAADSYAIYSMLMPGDEIASMPAQRDARWAINDITVNETDRNPAVPPQGQLKPPPGNPRPFQEAVGDYETNKNVRVQLTRDGLHIDHDFALLSPPDAAQVKAVKSGPEVSSGQQSQWGIYAGVTYFSEVYFDKKHTAALVYMNDWCAHLCASGTWIYLEKHGGHWVRRSGIVAGGG